MTERATVVMPSMCSTHRSLPVRQTGYGPADAWQALEIMTNVALFQGATCDPKVHEETGGQIENVGNLGCLACRKPDLFGEIVHVMEPKGGVLADLKNVKELGERWVREAVR